MAVTTHAIFDQSVRCSCYSDISHYSDIIYNSLTVTRKDLDQLYNVFDIIMLEFSLFKIKDLHILYLNAVKNSNEYAWSFS